MSLVCGVDPSLTSAGVATLRDGQPIHTSTEGFPGTDGASYQKRNRRGRWTAAKVRDAALAHGTPDLAVIEQLPHHIQGIGVEDRCYLWGKIYEAFDAHAFPRGIPIVVINPQTLKVWVTGKGASRDPGLTKYRRQKQDKQLMIDTVQSWWPQIKPERGDISDDIADALGLAAIGAHWLGDPMPFEVRPRHTTVLEKIAWPATA